MKKNKIQTIKTVKLQPPYTRVAVGWTRIFGFCVFFLLDFQDVPRFEHFLKVNVCIKA